MQLIHFIAQASLDNNRQSHAPLKAASSGGVSIKAETFNIFKLTDAQVLSVYRAIITKSLWDYADHQIEKQCQSLPSPAGEDNSFTSFLRQLTDLSLTNKTKKCHRPDRQGPHTDVKPGMAALFKCVKHNNATRQCRCPECPEVFSTLISLIFHHRTNHHGSLVDTGEWRECDCEKHSIYQTSITALRRFKHVQSWSQVAELAKDSSSNTGSNHTILVDYWVHGVYDPGFVFWMAGYSEIQKRSCQTAIAPWIAANAEEHEMRMRNLAAILSSKLSLHSKAWQPAGWFQSGHKNPASKSLDQESSRPGKASVSGSSTTAVAIEFCGGIRTCNPGAPVASSSRLTGKTPQGSNGSKRGRKVPHNPSDGKKRQKTETIVHNESETLDSGLLFFDCPFRKYDPIGHARCQTAKLRCASRVKDHILQRHSSDYYCDECFSRFKDNKGMNDHFRYRLSPCVQREPIDAGTCLKQTRETLQKTPFDRLDAGKYPDQTSRWYLLWRILFGVVVQPPATPYLDDNFAPRVNIGGCEGSWRPKVDVAFDSALHRFAEDYSKGDPRSHAQIYSKLDHFKKYFNQELKKLGDSIQRDEKAVPAQSYTRERHGEATTDGFPGNYEQAQEEDLMESSGKYDNEDNGGFSINQEGSMSFVPMQAVRSDNSIQDTMYLSQPSMGHQASPSNTSFRTQESSYGAGTSHYSYQAMHGEFGVPALDLNPPFYQGEPSGHFLSHVGSDLLQDDPSKRPSGFDRETTQVDREPSMPGGSDAFFLPFSNDDFLHDTPGPTQG